MKLIYSLLLSLFLFTNCAHAYTSTQCMNSMYSYYVFVEKQLDDLAKEQLEVAGETCKAILENEDQEQSMTVDVLRSKKLIEIYARLIDKGLVPSQIKSD